MNESADRLRGRRGQDPLRPQRGQGRRRARRARDHRRARGGRAVRVDLGLHRARRPDGRRTSARSSRSSSAARCPGSRKGTLAGARAGARVGQKQQADRLAGQGSIFDLGDTSRREAAPPSADRRPTSSRRTSCSGSRRRCSASTSPSIRSRRIRDQLRRKTDATIAELERRRDGEVVIVGGIVAAVKQMTTKTRRADGVPPARGHHRRRSRCVVFNSTYASARELCVADRILIVKGRVDHKEGETKLVALEVAAFEAVAERREVRLRIDATPGARPASIRELAQLVKRVPRRERRCCIEMRHLAGPADAARSAPTSASSRPPTSSPRSRRSSASRRSPDAADAFCKSCFAGATVYCRTDDSLSEGPVKSPFVGRSNTANCRKNAIRSQRQGDDGRDCGGNGIMRRETTQVERWRTDELEKAGYDAEVRARRWRRGTTSTCIARSSCVAQGLLARARAADPALAPPVRCRRGRAAAPRAASVRRRHARLEHPLAAQRRRPPRAAVDPHVRRDAAARHPALHLADGRPLGAPGRRLGSRLPRRGLGRRLRRRRRAPLPRHHLVGRGADARSGGRRSRSGRAASASGAGSSSDDRRGDRRAALGQQRRPRSWTRSRPGLLLAQGIGRIGNWWNQELFGKPTSLPWGLEIDADAPAARPVSRLTTFHPTFLYELIWDLAMVGVLLLLDRRFRFRPPALFALYVAYTASAASSRSCCGSTRRTTSRGCA